MIRNLRLCAMPLIMLCLGGGNVTAGGSCVYMNLCPTEKASGVHAVCYAIDQQGGKGNCSYAKDIMVTLCSDSHGTPHGVCYEKKDGED